MKNRLVRRDGSGDELKKSSAPFAANVISGFANTDPEAFFVSEFASTKPEGFFVSGFASTNPETLQ